jgi:hypothetical protein
LEVHRPGQIGGVDSVELLARLNYRIFLFLGHLHLYSVFAKSIG